MDYASRIWFMDCSELLVNLKINNDVIICRCNVIVKLFWRDRFFLLKLKYWSNFHVNVMTVQRELTRNPETEKTHVWVLSNIRALERFQNVFETFSEFCPISEHWNVFGKPNLAWMFLMSSYWMLCYEKVTAFTVSELRTDNRGGEVNV